MNIYEKLMNVQAELKAPKGQYNSFGKYKYRSCEDILEAVKPLLKKNGLTLCITDHVEQIGDRFYVVAEAILYDTEDDEGYHPAHIRNTAYAREDTEKKGMDGSQITGTASSYARKYCLNGLFLIDDTKDADTDEYTARTRQTGISKAQAAALEKMLGEAEKTYILNAYKVGSLADLTGEQYAETIKAIQAKRGNK